MSNSTMINKDKSLIVGFMYTGLDPGGGGGGGGDGTNPENQFQNGAKFLCLKGKGRTIFLFLHQKCLNVNSSGHKDVIFQSPHAC